jgi:hypothetical protein
VTASNLEDQRRHGSGSLRLQSVLAPMGSGQASRSVGLRRAL